jgi:3-hydroxyacyl-[acyl-carrier-protein] dehydratase
MTIAPTNFVYKAPFGTDIIRKIIPHRYPFLLVDRVTEMGEDYVRAYKNLTANEEVFQGHFPQEPVYPGVMHIETMAQAGACWILSREENVGKVAYLMTIEMAKFRRPVGPGDRLDIFGRITKLKGRIGWIECTIHVDDKLISEANFTFAFQRGANDAGQG